MSENADLFGDAPRPDHVASGSNAHQPLAERLRPVTVDQVVGQSHLLDADKPLRVALNAGEPHSMLLWGPPGVGKTTLARLLANHYDAQFIAISAVLGGVKDIREAVALATAAQQAGRQTILFVDEVHRFNKSQQDAFLPHVESGLITFIGATTENPSFEVNNALLSRARVYVLKPLSPDELRTLLERAATEGKVTISDSAADTLIAYADGDARRLLNAIEVVSLAARTQDAEGDALIDDALLTRSTIKSAHFISQYVVLIPMPRCIGFAG